MAPFLGDISEIAFGELIGVKALVAQSGTQNWTFVDVVARRFNVIELLTGVGSHVAIRFQVFRHNRSLKK